jgi:hypothetical protein
MHAQNMEPWYWTLLWLPDAVPIDESATPSRRSDGLSFPREVRVRHARASRTTCHDRCQGCTVSFARHARPSTNLLDKPSLPDATSCPEDQIPLAAAASGCETNRLPRGTAWQPRLFKDVFMRVPVRLELLEEGLCSG